MIDYENKQTKPVYDNSTYPNLTLDEAVKYIPKNIEYLDTLVQQAKLRYGNNSDEMAAVQLYVMEWGNEPLCKSLNEALKSGHQDKLKPWLRYLQLFRAGVERFPSFKAECWCGTDTNIGSNFNKGQIVTWQGITSCSRSQDFILKHCVGTSGTLIKINATNGKDISYNTHDPNTREVILMPGTTLVVKRVALHPNNSKITLVELEEIVDKKYEGLAQTVSKPQASSSANGPNSSLSNSNQHAAQTSSSTKSTDTSNETKPSSKLKYDDNQNPAHPRSGSYASSSKHETNPNFRTKSADNYDKTKSSSKSKHDDYENAAHASSGTLIALPKC
ncbi:unnamed protein product [Rotaria sp. Silwood2]|nr:unnamed protein product [Rotaria sp. Silwood2]